MKEAIKRIIEICENTSYSFESKECMVASIINNNIKDVIKQSAVDWLQKSFSNEQDQYYRYIAFYSYNDPMKEAKKSLVKHLSQ